MDPAPAFARISLRVRGVRKSLAPLVAVAVAVALAGCVEETALSANPKKCEKQLTKGASPRWLANNWDIDPSQSIAIAAEIFDLCNQQPGKYATVEEARDRVGVRLSDKGY